MFFNAGGTGPNIGQLGYYTKYAPEAERNPQVAARFTKEGHRLLNVLEGRLGHARYLAGEAFSMADVMNVTWARAGLTLGLDGAAYPNLQRWLGEVEARPAVKRALAMKPS
jgi:GST-like protein